MKRRDAVYLLLFIGTFSCKKENLELNIRKNQGYTNQYEAIIESISRNHTTEKHFRLGEYDFTGGYTQISNNQDAYVICKRNEATIWSKYYDRSPDDSKVAALIASENDLYVAFSCTGGNTDFAATPGAFQESYGNGGGAKIVYLARIEALSGGVKSATFIGCKLNNGNTNTLRVEDENQQPITINSDGTITFTATKAYDRADGRLTPQLGTDDDCLISGGKWIGVFNPDMSLISGDCTP